MYIIIVGGGRIGEHLVSMLVSEGHSVVVIESDSDRVKYIAENYDVLAIKGNGSDVKYLEDANIKKADVLVASTGNDQINFVACQLAKSTYNVPKVVARTSNPANKVLYEKLGVDVVISTTEVAAQALYSGIVGFASILPFGMGDAEIINVIVHETSPIVGVRIKDVHLPWTSNIVVIYRDGKIVIPRGDEVVHKDDNLIIILKKDVEHKLKEILLGKGT